MGWWLFGVNSWWPRLVPELFGLATVLLTYPLSRQLWPSQSSLALLTPIVLLGMLGWVSQLDLFKFDVMLSFFVLCSVYFMVRALITQHSGYWLVTAVTLALAVLSKGPVCLLFILPALLTVPWWWREQSCQQLCKPRQLYYYRYVGLVMLVAAILVLFWALPAAYLGGKTYTQAIFWHQSAGRIAGDFGGVKQWYMYIIFLAWLLFPWTFWLPLWQGGVSLLHNWGGHRYDSGLRLLIAIILPAFLLLTLIPMKSERFIIPLLPWFALLFAYVIANGTKSNTRVNQALIAGVYGILGVLYLILSEHAPATLSQRFFWLSQLSPNGGYCLILLGISLLIVNFQKVQQNVYWVALTTILLFVLYNLSIVRVIVPYNDLRPMALQLAKIQQQHHPIAMYDADFEFEFFGRLHHPSQVLTTQSQLASWMHDHPDGWIVTMDNSVYPQRYILRSVKNTLQLSHHVVRERSFEADWVRVRKHFQLSTSPIFNF